MKYKHCPHCGHVSEKTDMYAVTEYDENGDIVAEWCSVVYVPHPLKNIQLVDYIGNDIISEYAEIDFIETLDIPFIKASPTDLRPLTVRVRRGSLTKEDSRL